MALFSTSIQHCMSGCVCGGSKSNYVNRLVTSTIKTYSNHTVIHTGMYRIVLTIDASLSVLPCVLSACSISILTGDVTLKQKFLSVSVTWAGWETDDSRMRSHDSHMTVT